MLSATDYIVPTAEIVDGRAHRITEADRPRNVLDGVADDAGNAALIVGGRPMRPMDLDLRWVDGVVLPQQRHRGMPVSPPRC